jgi:tetratricopeptide (TPR) repeat protein
MKLRRALESLKGLAARERERLTSAAVDFAPTRTTVVPLVSLFLVLILLASVAGFLARAYHTEKHDRAARYFRYGQTLAEKGRYEEAVQQYRAALTLSRDDRGCKLALASALLQLGRPGEAEAHLKDLLQTYPTDGQMNLMMARLLAAGKDPASAEIYFNRAIYGFWPDGDSSRRVDAHFELADLFLQIGADRKAVGELMRMQADLPENPVLERQLGHRFLRAGAPREAAAVFRRVLRRNRGDAEAYAGLGEAEFQNEKYSVARTAFAYALRLNPGDKQLRKRYELADETNRLDPTLPRLRASERYVRTRTLVEQALKEIESCVPEDKAPEDPNVAALIASAREAIKGRKPGQDYSDAADANLELLEQQMSAAQSLCGPAHETPQPLALIAARVGTAAGGSAQPGSEQGSAPQ